MKTPITLCILAATLALLFTNQNGLIVNSSGSIGGFSSSGGDSGNSCGMGGCHGGGHTIQNGFITTNIPVSGYTPGMTYRIDVAGTSGSGAKFGFELAAENTSNGTAGNLAPASSGSREQIRSNGHATHTSSGNSGISGNFGWQLDWTAPVAGTGDVRFSAAVLVANNNGANTGDAVIIDSTTVIEATTTSISEINKDNTTLYPNPLANNLNIYSEANLTHITILNVEGKIVLDAAISSVDQIDVSHLTKGIYFVSLNSRNSQFTQKVMKL